MGPKNHVLDSSVYSMHLDFAGIPSPPFLSPFSSPPVPLKVGPLSSSPYRSLPLLRSRPLLQVGALVEHISSLSRSGQSPATKRIFGAF